MTTTKTTGGRSPALDALRGVAALIVLVSHCALIFPSFAGHHATPFHGGTHDLWSWLQRTPAFLLIDGKAAVLVFFVLSGFVLTPSLENRRTDALAFALKRVVRIWPVFALAILLSAAFRHFADRGVAPHLSPWFETHWSGPESVKHLLAHLTMSGKVSDLDSPMWSLIHEMRVSLVFPLLYLAVRFRPAIAVTVSGALSILCAKLLGHGQAFPLAQALETVGYLFFFMLGIAMATKRHVIQSFLERVSGSVLVSFWVGALALLLLSPLGQIQSINARTAAFQLLAGVGAAAVVALCYGTRSAAAILAHPVPVWLGRVSYSLYLIHIPILLLIGHAAPQLTPLAVTALTLPMSLLAAEGLHRWAEKPSIRASRAADRWARRLTSRPTMTPAASK